MKQKRTIGHLIFITIFLALFFPAGQILNPASADAAEGTTGDSFVDGEVIAKISLDADTGAIATKYALDMTLLKSSPDGNIFILRTRQNVPTKKIISSLKKNPAILSVQPNFKYKMLARIPNDRYFSREWPLADTASTPGGVSAPSAWDLEVKNKNKIPIAIIDSGIGYKQPEIKESITGGSAKGIDITKPKKKPQDSDGHGTFLAGLIAAKTNNKKGLSGASFFGNLKIMPIKFDFTTTQAISAISYAKGKHVPIINASWGGYGDEGLDLALKDTIANFPGVFVTAAGNGDPNTDIGYDHDAGIPTQKMYPCDFELPNILCVAASGIDGALAGYSDYGALSVDVAAPGGTDDNLIFGLSLKKNKFTEAEGSSASTAYVSAEAGLLLSQKPYLSPSQIIDIIKSSVDPEPSLSGKILTGGKVNFQKALQTAAASY